MSTNLYFIIRLALDSYKKILIDDINLQHKVEVLRNVAAEKTNVSRDKLELIYSGNILEDHASIESYGIRSGVCIHVLLRKEKELPNKVNKICESDILHLGSAFKNAVKNPNYRSALQRLSRPEVIENIIVATPGLADDPVAISIIQDPELLTHLCDSNTVRRVVETHPSLADAAHYIVAVVYEEAASTATNLTATTSSGYSYSLDALSDDEEMDSSQSSDSQPRPGRSGDGLSPHITTAQLAAALASATGSGATSNPVSQSPSSSSLISNTIITSEMFNNAIQQAIAGVPCSTPGSGASRSTSTGSDLGDFEAQSRQLNRNLQQMHELGLMDDTYNIQALQATDWNVQEAINLVFSGAIGDHEVEEEDNN